MKVGIFQFHGCDKCLAETMLLGGDHEVIRVPDSSSWTGGSLDVAVITGYLRPGDRDAMGRIAASSKRLIAYGSCPASGGVFGLAYQRGHPVVPLAALASNSDVVAVHGCLAGIGELEAAVWGKTDASGPLCPACPRRPTCQFLDEVVRQVEIEEGDETCFNDKGFLCNGYVSRSCKESCVSWGTPCRACKPAIPDPGFRMLGMFATLMANVEVATEATGKGGTDKLADEPDDVMRSVPDVSGSFFRFCLASSRLPAGRAPPTGSPVSDVLTGRPIEEVPLITGLIGGTKFVSLTLDAIEAYENGTGIAVSPATTDLRARLRSLEQDIRIAIETTDPAKYKAATDAVRAIAGNMNLSNVFFGGFKVMNEIVTGGKARPFEIRAGTYRHGRVSYDIDDDGMVTRFAVEGD